MSHVVTIATEVRDPTAVAAACRRLELPAPVAGRAKLFTEEVEGLAVRLPNWRYPVVCQTETGTLKFDDYGGRWGERRHLDAFLQSYAMEKASLEARRAGHSVTERPLPDGSIKLEVHVGG